jgi:hypothetical protein
MKITEVLEILDTARQRENGNEAAPRFQKSVHKELAKAIGSSQYSKEEKLWLLNEAKMRSWIQETYYNDCVGAVDFLENPKTVLRPQVQL